MIKKIMLVSTMAILGSKAVADPLSEKEKQDISPNLIAYQKFNHYDFLAKLNRSVKAGLTTADFQGLKNIFTYQRNNQVVINVIHDPFTGYQDLIDDIAESASRINGVNLQNSITLHILQSYCQQGNFYQLKSRQLDDQVLVQYESLNGQRVAVHKINRQLCS